MNEIIGVYRERLKGTSTSTVTTLSSERVRAHEFRQVLHICVYNGDSATRDVDVYIDTHGYNHRVAYFNDVTVGEWSYYRIELYLEENERLTFSFLSIASAKTMEVHLTGILMKKE